MQRHLVTSLGLGEKPGRIYLAGLELGTTTIQELARVSGIKRSTVYTHMDNLLAEGMFETITRGKKRYYRALNPEALELRLRENLQQFQTALPRLISLRTETMGSPQVRLIEGITALNELYLEVTRAHSVRAWSNVGPVYEPFHGVYQKLAETVRERSVSVKDIIADTPLSRRYARLIMKLAGTSHLVRFATVPGIESDTLIFGNVVAIFRLVGNNVFAVRIEDKSIADTMRAIHEMSWKTARPFH